jgi:hypothetical protein
MPKGRTLVLLSFKGYAPLHGIDQGHLGSPIRPGRFRHRAYLLAARNISADKWRTLRRPARRHQSFPSPSMLMDTLSRVTARPPYRSAYRPEARGNGVSE